MTRARGGVDAWLDSEPEVGYTGKMDAHEALARISQEMREVKTGSFVSDETEKVEQALDYTIGRTARIRKILADAGYPVPKAEETE